MSSHTTLLRSGSEWPKIKIQISCMGKKVPFGQFFRNWLIGWIGHALLVQPSKTTHRIFFFLSFIFQFSFIFLNSDHSDPDPSNVVKHILCYMVCKYIVTLHCNFILAEVICPKIQNLNVSRIPTRILLTLHCKSNETMGANQRQ